MGEGKRLLRALAGEVQRVPPVWLMRQAGRYLPEYRATRARAGDFLSLCYTPDLAAEVTMQPVRRFGLDGAILFADILLVAQALGARLWFAEGEGPRLSPVATAADIARLRPAADIHDTLAPVYATVGRVARDLPPGVALIGFAGAPWTVATYMIAGRGTPGQGPAHALKRAEPALLDRLIERLAEATVEYLAAQAGAGAEVVMLFDSWAGSLAGADFDRYAVAPVRAIVAALKARFPGLPVIAFPRGAGPRHAGFSRTTGADCISLDQGVDPLWAAAHVQTDGCVQGNLDPALLVAGGAPLAAAARAILAAFAGGPHVFNLGHGLTPEARPEHVAELVALVRGG